MDDECPATGASEDGTTEEAKREDLRRNVVVQFSESSNEEGPPLHGDGPLISAGRGKRGFGGGTKIIIKGQFELRSSSGEILCSAFVVPTLSLSLNHYLISYFTFL